MASTYLSRTSGTPTSQKIGTFSLWIKRSKLVGAGYEQWFSSGNSSTTDLNNRWNIKFTSTEQIELFNVSGGSTNMKLLTNRVFRDVNAWYHIVFAVDTTQATASDRLKMWVNGVQETSFSTSTYPSLDDTSCQFFQSGKIHRIGAFDGSGTYPYYLDGLITHYHYTDGTAYDASTFGEYDAQNVWKPKTQPSVTYGTNGFFLKFANAGSLGTDSSANGNDFTVNGTGTQTLDTPSNVFATMNVLNPQSSGFTVVNGNLSLTANATNAWRTTYGTLAVSSGKWYWEQKVTAASGSAHYIGITDQDENRSSATNDFENANVSAYCYRGDGGKVTSVSGSTVLTPGVGDSFTTGDIIGVAMDLDNQKIYFSKNGTWQASGDPTSGATGTGSFFDITAGKLYTPATAVYNTGSGYQYNFGNGYYGTTAVSTPNADGAGYGKFEYSVPTGYYALCTKNIQTYG